MQGYSVDPESGETKIREDVSSCHVFNVLSILLTLNAVLRKKGVSLVSWFTKKKFNFIAIPHIFIFQASSTFCITMDALGIYPILKSFLAGSVSGTFSTILFQPLDLIKTRLQSRVELQLGSPNRGTVNTVIHIIKKENVFGLWRGMTPSITRVIPGVGLYFSSIHWLKHTFHLKDPLTPTEAMLLGVTARSTSGAFLIPITVVKTRFESDVYKYNSIREALKLIYKQEGVRGLSSGLVPTLLRDAPFSGLYLMFYTQLKNIVVEPELPRAKSSVPIHFSCGILAGIFASIVTQPADVIKTKMQLYPNEFRGVLSATFRVYKKYGMLGYFKGIVPRMLRRTLVTAMAWTVYEEVTKSMGLK